MKRSSGLRVSILAALALVLLLSGGGMQLDLRANGGPATLTTWGIPTPDSLPLGVAIDPANGQVYFAEFVGDKIGRLDPGSNLITEWPAGDGPQYLALDISTGNVSIYFTEGLGNRNPSLGSIIGMRSIWGSRSSPAPASQRRSKRARNWRLTSAAG